MVNDMAKKEDLKKQILELTREYYQEVHGTSKRLICKLPLVVHSWRN